MGRKELIAKARQTVEDQAKKMSATAAGETPNEAAAYLLSYGYGPAKIAEVNPQDPKAVAAVKNLFGGKEVPPEYKNMRIADIITKMKLIAAKSMSATAAPTTDAQGTPEIGGAPADESVEAPNKKETPEGQIESGDAASAAADGSPTATPAAPAAETPAAAAPAVQIADNSAVALVKVKDQLNTMKEDIAIKQQVIKETEKMLADAGIPVNAAQTFFNARASYIAGRIPASEVKRHLAIVAKAEKIVEAMVAEASELSTDESEELAGIKAALATAIEKAQDALGAVSEGKPGDHRANVVAALREIELASKEYGYFKKLLAFKDDVADTIVAVAQFIEEKKIAAKAEEIVNHFDRFVSMGGKERQSVKAFMVAQTPGFSNGSISTVAGMTPHAAKDPIAEIEELGMKTINGEKRTERVS